MDYSSNLMLRKAVEREIEIIGEATKTRNKPTTQFLSLSCKLISNA